MGGRVENEVELVSLGERSRLEEESLQYVDVGRKMEWSPVLEERS